MATQTQNSIQIALGVTGLNSVLNAFKSIEHSLAGITGLVAKWAAPVTAVIGAIVSTQNIHKVYELGVSLDILTKRTGIAIQQLIVLRKAFELGGSSAEEVGPLINKMEKAIYDVAVSGGVGEEKFTRLGISFRDLLSQDTTKQFETIARGLVSINDPAERAALAIEIFGRAGGQILPALLDGSFFKNLAGGAGTFGEAMARLAHPLHELHVSLSVLSSFGVKLFAGILDNLPITELADRIKAISNSVDFTAIGQKFGAFVIAAINAWKAGRFGEFVALSFEIGFDKTVELFNEALSRMGKLVEAWDIGKIILSAISTGLFGLTKAVGTALITVLTTVIGTIDYILSAFQDKFNESLNKISSGIKTLYGAIGITVSNAPPLERKSLGFQEALAARGKEMEAKLDEFTATLDDWNSSIILALIPGAAGSAGTPGGLGGAGSPQQRMAKLMEEAQGGVTKAIEGSHHATEELNHSSSNLLVTYSKLRDVTDEMQVKAARLNELEQQRFAIENDFAMTEAEKWQKRRAILLEELEIRTRQAELQREAASRLSGKEADAALGRASGFDAQAIQVGRQLDAQGADPFSFPKQMASEWKKQLDAIGTFARATAQTVGNVFQTAFSGISAGISGVLRGTMTWGNALMNIGTNVMDAVIQGIVRMFAAWIAGIWAKQAAATSANSIEAVGAGIVAFFTSVSSYGAAGWLGLAAVLAGVGLVAAAAAGAFEAGGFTGPGPASQPAGIVHAGEYVFSAPAVQRIGVPTLAALHEGTGVAPGGAQGTTHFIVVDSMAAAEKMAQSRKGRSIYTRMGMEQSLEVGHVG